MESLPITELKGLGLHENGAKQAWIEKKEFAGEAGENLQKKAEKLWIAKYEYNLIRFIKAFFPEEKSYILSLPISRMHIRDISMPAAKPNQIAQMLAFEAEENLPASLEEVEVIGHPWFSDKENVHMLAFALSQEFMETAVRPLLKEDAAIASLPADASLLAAFLNTLPEQSYLHSTLGQLHMGASHTILNVVHHGKLAFTRSLPFGGNELTSFYSSLLGLDFESAEKKKLDMNMDLADCRHRPDSFYREHEISKHSYHAIQKQSRAYLEKLCLEIERSLFALRCAQPNCFYLSGGLSLSKGLAPLMSEHLQRQVESYPLSLSNKEAPEIWALALGATQERALPQEERDNFLKTAFGSTLRGGRFHLSAFKTPFIFLAASLAIFFLSLTLGILNDQKRLTDFESSIFALGKEIPGLLADNSTAEQILQEATGLCQKRLQGLRKADHKILAMLQEITQNAPAKESFALSFRQLRFDGKALELEVEVQDLNNSTVLQEKLGASASFRSIEAKRRVILPDKKTRITYRMEAKKPSAQSALSCQ